MRLFSISILLLVAFAVRSQDASIEINAGGSLHRTSRFMTGACIEDVNHEVYGGIDSQMIFGESFAEPKPPEPLNGFKMFGGKWVVARDGSIGVTGSSGAKIIPDAAAFSEGEASVDLWLTEANGGNAGLIVKVTDAANGADAFTGYEISLERPGTLVIGRHRQNWEPLQRVPCDVPLNQWITLAVRLAARSLEVFVNDQRITQYEDTEHPLPAGTVGLRTWQHDVRFRNFTITTGGAQTKIPFGNPEQSRLVDAVSGMWRGIRQGTASGSFNLIEENPFSGPQSQRLTFASGSGEVAVENQGLNRWGMNFIKGKSYEGYLYVRGVQPTELFVALESRDGTRVYAEKKLKSTGTQWQRVEFKLKPTDAESAGRFSIKLKQPGSIDVGYAFVQPGDWGRFKGLPVRKDVGQGLVDQGVTVLRYGGCMANAAEYRWKKMIGPREQRPPYKGWWYPESSNGWGVFDFLNFCEAAGFLAVPDLNCNETPEDMADFIEYVNGPAKSKWGQKRAAEGHSKPYGLKYVEIGNEEKVNEEYWLKFKGIAEAVWARDPDIILVVGDFAYDHTITDPFHFTGAAGGITTLAAQQKILQLAKAHNREVWFDVHVGTEGPRPHFGGTFSYIDALEKLAEGAKHRVVIFEYNAGNHSQRRALANAAATIAVERDGRLPIVTSANCLQPDKQNDNDWDQGLLFLNPSKVWLQPPGYVTQMTSRNYQPLQLPAEAHGDNNQLEVSAKRSEDGKTLVLQVVNFSEQTLPAKLAVRGFVPKHTRARVEELSAPLDAVNTADATERVKPNVFDWKHQFTNGQGAYRFAPHSLTIIRMQ